MTTRMHRKRRFTSRTSSRINASEEHCRARTGHDCVGGEDSSP